MRIQLVFHTWLDEADDDIYFTNEGIYLKMSDFHVGSTFDARIELDLGAADDLRAALARGYKPVFYAMAVDPDSWIPVGDRLPPGRDLVWAYDVQGGLVKALYYSHGGWWKSVERGVGLDGVVTHWQPIDKPEPPKKGK